jgi:hypothetical protein
LSLPAKVPVEADAPYVVVMVFCNLAAKADRLLWPRLPEGRTDMKKLFLSVAGIFLIPVALSYGVDPAKTLPMSMNVTVDGTDQTHIFRALACLYLGMVSFCLIAAFVRPSWQHVAVIWAVFFAYSLAIGRIISLIVDGIPSPMLLFYLAVELVVGTLFVLARERRKASG